MKIFSNLILDIRKLFTKGPIKEGGRNPYVDWAMIIIVSSIVLLILIVNGVRLFKLINSGDIQGQKLSVATSTEVFDVKNLDYIIEKFNVKAGLFNNTKKSYRSIVDPSI